MPRESRIAVVFALVLTAIVTAWAVAQLDPPAGPIADSGPSLSEIAAAIGSGGGTGAAAEWSFVGGADLPDGTVNDVLTGSGVIHAIKVNPQVSGTANQGGFGYIRVVVDGRVLGVFADNYPDGSGGTPHGFYTLNVRYESDVDLVLDSFGAGAGALGYTILYRADP